MYFNGLVADSFRHVPDKVVHGTAGNKINVYLQILIPGLAEWNVERQSSALPQDQAFFEDVSQFTDISGPFIQGEFFKGLSMEPWGRQ